MADDLEQYLRTDYPSAKKAVAEVQRLIEEVVSVFTWIRH
jgi:hypothetical protein